MNHADERRRMVDHDLLPRGIDDPAVLRAMGTVPREAFVPARLEHSAYADQPLPIGEGQTISQPYIVAAMAQAALVAPGDAVLEIGTGSGYGAAVLHELGASVVTVERHAALAVAAEDALAATGHGDVRVVVGDGTLGWESGAPYDAIVVTAAAPRPPEALLAQLVDSGRLVIPLGDRHGGQELARLVRTGTTHRRDDLGGVRFVPLLGAQGFDP